MAAVPSFAVRLGDWSAVRAAGAEAEVFLQGQLSSDLRQLSLQRAQWSGWSSPKGRLLVLPLLVRDADGTIDLWMPAGLIDAVLKRLRMFVLRSKVTLDDGRNSRAALGLIGPDCDAVLAANGLPIPSDQLQVCRHGDIQIIRARGTARRFLLLGGKAQLEDLLPQCSDDVRPWRAADIAAGIPVVLPSTQERWVAQMVNLDLLGGVSFDKGCYTGQEVIARLHYLGNLKKRMFRVRGSGAVPEPGSAIRDATGDGQAVGEIVDAVPDGEGYIASAVLQIAVADSGRLQLDRDADAALECPQAYAYE